MEQIKYRKTLDVHKNGVQFLLQGFETADKLSRVIEISLMASGDAIDFPLERIVAMMYVTTPGATEPSINECTIKDNKVVYEVLPIVEEGLTTMQLKLIETSPDGATSVLASPKFAVEVTKSDVDDEGAEQTTTFTALEDAMAKAKTVYDERFLRMELTSDCTFKAYYADGTVYETDILKKLFLNGNVLLSESFARGGTGVRAGEDTDNSMYYSNVSKSESLNAKAIMENSEEILEEVKLHGMYTAFSVDFETGDVEYVSPSFKFNVNIETGELEADGQTYTFEEELCRIVADWLAENGVILEDLQKISTQHSTEISELQEESKAHGECYEYLKNTTIPEIMAIPPYLSFVGSVNADILDATFGKSDGEIGGIGCALSKFSWYKGDSKTEYPHTILKSKNRLTDCLSDNDALVDIINTDSIYGLFSASPYAFELLKAKYDSYITYSLSLVGYTYVSLDESVSTISNLNVFFNAINTTNNPNRMYTILTENGMYDEIISNISYTELVNSNEFLSAAYNCDMLLAKVQTDSENFSSAAVNSKLLVTKTNQNTQSMWYNKPCFLVSALSEGGAAGSSISSHIERTKTGGTLAHTNTNSFNYLGFFPMQYVQGFNTYDYDGVAVKYIPVT